MYRQMTDGGFAPHISKHGYLTLTICKPKIRRSAEAGDYVMALAGSSLKQLDKQPDKYRKVSYIYQVTDKVPMKNYMNWCRAHAPNKIPAEPNYIGDCQYNADLRWMEGPHDPSHTKRNLSGCYSVVSEHFGAWTFENLYSLTDADLAAMGFTEETLRGVKRDHRVYTLTPALQAHLEALMAAAPRTELSFKPEEEVGDHVEEPMIVPRKTCKRRRARRQTCKMR